MKSLSYNQPKYWFRRSWLCFLRPGTGPWARPAVRSWCPPCPRYVTALQTSSSRIPGILWPRSRWRSWKWRIPRLPGTRPCRWRRSRRGAPPGRAQWGPRCSDPATRNKTQSLSRSMKISCLKNILNHIIQQGWKWRQAPFESISTNTMLYLLNNPRT